MIGASSSSSKDSAASKPFVVAAVVLVFAGTATGAVWMMLLFGAGLPFVDARAFSLHRTFQVDGFLTLLVMGIGYMIVPRFRNAVLPSPRKIAYASFALVLTSIALQVVSALSGGAGTYDTAASASKVAGVGIFAGAVFWSMRVRPRLLGMADWFIAASAGAMLVLAVTQLVMEGQTPSSFPHSLLFPILMIFGVEYKTMPSFLGFIRPKKKTGVASAALAVAAAGLGALAAMTGDGSSHELAVGSGLVLLACAGALASSLYVFGGFDNSEIMRLISGEKKARYLYTTNYARLAFAFLFAGSAMGVLYFAGAEPAFVLYDLAIHFTAVGFVGITIALYLPLMLPPITGKAVRFERFSHAPVLMVVAALALRAAGDAAMAAGAAQGPVAYLFMSSGWLVVAALAAFVAMIHRSMQQQQQQPSSAHHGGGGGMDFAAGGK